ncbi:hypothetical protein ACQ86G_12505 [Roseateles chitinivorans]|uniref:hypothetical protein n=1 Tax=Roseateles chitinivorans TaxID=2917965 RepID=UPI003D673846
MSTTISALWRPHARSHVRHHARLAAIAGLIVLTLGLGACDQRARDLREYERSIVKATPFLQVLQRGKFPTDAAIKAADIGPYEPLLLSQIGFRREIKRVLDAYEAKWDALDVDGMLHPEQSTNAASRARSMAKLRAASTWNSEFEDQMTTVIEQGERKVLAEMKKAPYDSATAGNRFNEQVTRQYDYYMDLAAWRTDFHRHAVELLTLLDTHRKSVQLKKGAQVQLVFSDEAVLKQYNAKVEEIQAVVARSQAMNDKFNADQAKIEKTVMDAVERARINTAR